MSRERAPEAQWLDVTNASRLLGLTEKALRARLARREIPFRKLGSRILLNRAELTEWLDKLPGVGVGEALANVAARARDSA